ncbi:MAG: OmcA/MtrC family decaheme c-type cytochrome [Acidobacteriota bacterium]
MALVQCGIVLLAAASTLTPSHQLATPRPRLVTSRPAPTYTAQQAEFYLSAAQVEYIRPGYKVTLVGITDVAPGKKPVVEVRFTDDLDQPLDFLGKATPGPLSMSFVLGWYDAAERQYHSYTFRNRGGVVGPGDDRGGKWNHIELGHSTYTFATTLPANMDLTKTTTLTIYGRRSLTSIIGKDYIFNNINHDFRPDGKPVTETWAAMDVAACNTCHDPLAGHGGPRNTPKTCVMCHQPELPNDAATGNSFDFKVMIHKIHRGMNLPSVVAGGKYGFGTNDDFSTVALPQDIRNCTTCHQPSAAEGHIWYTNPSRKACGSCHDDVNWVTGEGHVAGPQDDDTVCAICHQPEGESEFDASIKGAHTIPTKSAQLKGLKIEIVSVSNTAPGSKPTVIFKLTNGDGSNVAPSSLNRLRFLLGGATTDYTTYVREDGVKATASGDAWAYTFTTAAIPADATGTWTLSADVYRNVTLNPGPATAVREAAQNPIVHFAVTDAQPVARRQIVDLAKCNKCHNTLALHGGQRFKVEECVICHNPNATGAVGQTTAKEGIHLKWMIHRLHTGEELKRDFTIGNANYNEVLYPGDRRNCEACHRPGTYDVPLPDGVLPTTTPRDFVPVWQPASASCLSCHDSIDAAAHAYVNIAPFGEACASCHGEARDFAVSKVHAR